MRKKNKVDMTVTEQLNAISDRMCEEYCKYYEKMKDMDEEESEKYADVYCLNCPLGEL